MLEAKQILEVRLGRGQGWWGGRTSGLRTTVLSEAGKRWCGLCNRGLP